MCNKTLLPKSAPRIASRSPIEAAEEKFPAGHAETGSEQKPSRESGKTTKTRWDPFARYHSNAHSFPDYVEPKHSTTMGPERLKQINGATRPVNTLSVRRYDSLNDPDVPASKRQKKDTTRTHGTTASPYFSNSKPSKSSDIQDIHVEGSHDDVYDIISTSSAGNASLGAIGLDEYRRVLRTDIDSPDVLAFEQRPSTVTNAVFDASRYFNSKRDRPYRLAENTGPQIKRQKPSTVKEPIDLSEDELQADFANHN
ncbi:hypothetical protein TASIC1_0005021800 [Trichoderma asperellum]|uniref:Uncharacterized protein n=1 Tax=Trichoderma asperellum TaxID=101201 RepID=A0A6V8QSL7_TRIAP|nr:hypothetical protein TASIC1_0005021800 [Trichoderma asperellum]